MSLLSRSGDRGEHRISFLNPSFTGCFFNICNGHVMGNLGSWNITSRHGCLKIEFFYGIPHYGNLGMEHDDNKKPLDFWGTLFQATSHRIFRDILRSQLSSSTCFWASTSKTNAGEATTTVLFSTDPICQHFIEISAIRVLYILYFF